MKSKLIFTLLFLYTCTLFAKEGMWLPFLLERMNEKEMKSLGMKINARDIYAINNGSLKDAVVIFGGGCTGEIISDKGLVLTNHHCGYGAVQGLSSVQHDYLTNGFWAKNQQEELPCPGLTVTFIVRIDAVTHLVQKDIVETMADSMKVRLRSEHISAIEKAYKDSTGYDASIKSFFYENEYYLFLTEKFSDIRLVGFPPNGIGKFGGDTDNWSWPRHTGDFGVFRIYANQQNKPASYAKENKPFTPKKSFPIQIGGIKPNDFTMVYGFPGKTNEYLISDGVAEVMNILDPIRISLREKRLSIMDADMKESKETFIKYASKQASIANYYKKWQGELLGLQINNAIQKKQEHEAKFRTWVQQDPERVKKYGSLLEDMKLLYAAQQKSIALNEYIQEAVWASELVKSAAIYSTIKKALDTMKHVDSIIRYKDPLHAYLKNCQLNTDKNITTSLMQVFAKNNTQQSYTDAEWIHRMYETSLLSSTEKINTFLALRNTDDLKSILQADPAYKMYSYYDSLQKVTQTELKKNQQKLNGLYGKYMLALQEQYAGKAFYPDANSTMRVTYGKVEGVTPKDGMQYTFQTTLDGMMQKGRDDQEEFHLPAKLKELYQTKDYGNYAITVNNKKTVPLAFLASNHTTGGNSGSPVINAKGELIGTNFDRIWEGTMSDILFDPNLCRNITLDIRFTLFIIEKFGGCKWLIDEMKLVR